jgi:hypothetical protein
MTLRRTLGGGLLIIIAGCHAITAKQSPVSADRSALYAAVLRDVRGDSASHWVVVDSLLPTTDLEADQHAMVLSGLAISRRELDAFLTVQRMPRDRFQPVMIPDARWRMVSMPQLDSLRAAARADAVSSPGPRTARPDRFWLQWQRAFPASGGYVVLSPASVSADGAMAVVHVRVACGPVCGETELRVMRRDAGGAWHTRGRVRLSES